MIRLLFLMMVYLFIREQIQVSFGTVVFTVILGMLGIAKAIGDYSRAEDNDKRLAKLAANSEKILCELRKLTDG